MKLVETGVHQDDSMIYIDQFHKSRIPGSRRNIYLNYVFIPPNILITTTTKR